MITPTLTIGLPVYNGEAFLAQALDALLDQTFEDFELIVTDNASTDGTEAICRRYAAQDARIRYLRNERNIGAAPNFNRSVALARGRYFKWAADDDLCAPAFLETCVEALDADPTVVLASTDTQLINENGSPLVFDKVREAFIDSYGRPWYWSFEPQYELADVDPVTRFRSVLLRTAWCVEVFGVIRTDVLRRTSLIGDFYGSDKVLLAELSLFGRFHKSERPLFLRRCHPKQSSYQTPRRQAEWISGRRAGLIVLPQWRAFRGYLGALRRADLSLTDQARGTAAVLELAFRPEKLRRLFIPGPDNYFGLGTSGVRRAKCEA